MAGDDVGARLRDDGRGYLSQEVEFLQSVELAEGYGDPLEQDRVFGNQLFLDMEGSYGGYISHLFDVCLSLRSSAYFEKKKMT